MRLLFFLCALALGASASWSDDLFSSEQPRYTRAANYYGDIPNEPEHKRLKRSIFAAVSGAKTPCDEGWTGPYCENPICHDRHELIPFESDMEKTVDVLHLPANCVGEYYVPYDAMSDSLSITVTVDTQIEPIVTLTDPKGNTASPTKTEPHQRGVKVTYKTNPASYVMTINLNGVPSKSCIVHIEAASKVTFDGGFVNGPRNDRPPYGESGEAAVANYFIAHPFNLMSPSEVKTVTIRQIEYLGALYRSVLTRRYECAYEYYAGEFTCKAGNMYLYTIDGTDMSGHMFRRSRMFSCYVPNGPSTPAPTTPQPPTSCQNGGSLLKGPTNNTYCFCRELFTGAQCQEAVCMNGGFQEDEDPASCDCPSGYGGRHCESVVCIPDKGKMLTDDKTLVVVIRNTQSMVQHIDKILNAIDDEVLRTMVEGKTVYQGFILSYIRDGVVTTTSYTMTQFQFFGAALEQLKTQYSSSGACTDKIIPALEGVFFQIKTLQSPVFIFTDAAADQSDIDSFGTVLKANSNRKLQMHTFYMRTQQNCGLNTNDPTYRFYHDLARYTAGLVHSPDPFNLYAVFLGAMRASTYKMNLVESGDLKQCANPNKAIIIDHSATNMTIIATGSNLQLALTDPNWLVNSVAPYYTDGYTHFWYFPDPVPGEYIFSIHSTQPSTACSYRVFTQSEYDLFLATTTAVDNDETAFEPTVGQPAHLTAQLNGLYGGMIRDHFRLNAEILITSPDESDKHQPLYYSNGIWRSACGYHLYFGIADFCQKENQIFYATVFADDMNGNPIQRVQMGYCSAGASPTPPTDGCLNGGVAVNGTQCWCPAHFTGDRCQRIQCQNMGTPNANGDACRCPYGLWGRFCEISQCSSQDQQFDTSPNFRSLALVISVKSTMQGVVTTLADRATDFSANIFRNMRDWIDQFVVVTVDQKSVTKYIANSAGDFVGIMANISKNFNSTADFNNKDCAVLLNDGISLALDDSYVNSNIFVFADSQATKTSNFSSLVDIMNRADDSRVQINLVGVSGDMCDGTGSFGTTESGVADFTNGRVMYTTKIDRIFTYISSQYRSNVIGQAKGDCMDGIDLYIPVDSLAHSLTFVVSGDALTLDITSPDNLQGTYKDLIIDDNKLKIAQYMTRCDMSWDQEGDLCYMFDINQIGWLASLVQCANIKGGAHIIDIFDAAKYGYVSAELAGTPDGAWLGLMKDSNNSWVWMQYGNGGRTIPLDNATAHWAPNEPKADSKYIYAWQKASDNLWYTGTMEDKHYTICQKRRYNGNFNPESEPDLPAGYWHAVIKGNTPGACTVQVQTQSDIEIFYGFVQDSHNDFARGSINKDSSSNYVVVTAPGLGGFTEHIDIPEGRLDYAILNDGVGDVLPLVMTERADCTFDAVSKLGFGCPVNKTLDQVFVTFKGIDHFGYPFQRQGVTRCTKYVQKCYNGGFLFNGACVCTNTHYAGIDCRTVLCENGGRGNLDGTCQCRDGFTGDFCELAKCDPPYPTTFPVNGRTLTIALETSFEMKVPLFYLQKSGPTSLESALKGLQDQHPLWFNNYYLYPFDSNSNKPQWANQTITNDIKAMQTAVKSIDACDDVTVKCSANCPRPITQVLIDILNNPKVSAPESVIVVVTRSAIEDYTLILQLAPLIMEKRVHIHFLLVGASSPCSLGWNDRMNQMMTTVAQLSIGSINTVTAKQISRFFTAYLPALYKASDVVMDSYARYDCDGREFVFQIDHSTTDFTIEFSSADPANMTVIGPTGQIDLPDNAIPGGSEYIGVFNVTTYDILPGTYVVRTTNTGTFCSLRVRANTDIQITPGFTQIHDGLGGSTQDDAHYAPLRGQKNGIVFHVEGLPNGTIEFAQVATSIGTIEYTRDVVRRDSACTYQYYMKGDFQCDRTEFEVILYGVDNKNMPFNRNYKYHCVDDRPMPLPPVPVCALQDVVADVTLLFDSSVPTSTFNQFKMMSLQLVEKYTIDPAAIRIAVATISSDAEKGGFFNFNKVTNKTGLTSALAGITADGSSGQDVTKAVSALNKDIFNQGAGYRKDPNVKHLLIYVTATEPTDSDPANAIRALVNGGTTGFALVTYNMANPSNKLLSLAEPECRFQGTESTWRYAANLGNNILCSHRRICGV